MEYDKYYLEYSSALQDITEVNSSFDAARLQIAYVGDNRNKTSISKQAFEKAVPTMFNCPVVAHYMREEDEIGSHDIEWVDEGNNDYKLVNITQPVGVVPESAKWNWEKVREEDGSIHNYLCTDVLLWKRQEAYQNIKENGVTKQSMEIKVNHGEMVDGYFEIDDFEFEAFCLLGDSVTPCFESAALFSFAKKEFETQYTQMLAEFKAAFAETKEGDKENMLKKLLEKYSVAESDLEFEVKGLTDEELEAKFAEVYEKVEVEEPEVEPEVAPAEDKTEETFEEDEPEVEEPAANEEPEEETEEVVEEGYTLNSNLREELYEAVRTEKVHDEEYGDLIRYYIVDYDEAETMVYCVDCMDYKMYGFAYTLDGDNVTVNFDTKKRMKYEIVEFEGDPIDEPTNFSYGEFAAEIKANIKAEYAPLEEELSQFKAAKRSSELEAIYAQFDAVFTEGKYAEEYSELKEHADDYSLDELSEKVYSLYGRKNFETFSLKKEEKKNISVKIPEKSDERSSLYGDVEIGNK